MSVGSFFGWVSHRPKRTDVEHDPSKLHHYPFAGHRHRKRSTTHRSSHRSRHHRRRRH